MSEALIVIDLQNDFTPGGALAVPDGDEVLRHINELIASGRFGPRRSRPATGIRPTTGRSLRTTRPALARPLRPAARRAPSCTSDLNPRASTDRGQGPGPGTEGYLGFDATGLADVLRERGVDGSPSWAWPRTTACATRRSTRCARGFAVTVDSAAVRPVDGEPGDGDRALEEIRAAGGPVT